MQYQFVSTWKIKAPLVKAWDAVYLSEQWPEWWSSVVSVTETDPGDVNGIGSVRIYKLKSPMLYTLSFNMLVTDRINYKLLKGNASGELAGTGEWHFEERDGITTIRCHWNVSTTKAWMNALGPVLKPLFRLNHTLVMREGGKSLARKLNAELLHVS